ncbi:MAG: hypothetical protein HS116_27185 [Planctomycetes bacterium]|nr:hypothetical protein [Planctomycetota bacterium]
MAEMKGPNRARFWTQHPQGTAWVTSLSVHALFVGGLLAAGLWYLGASNALRRPIPARAYGEKLEERVGSVEVETNWSLQAIHREEAVIVVLLPDESPEVKIRESKQPIPRIDFAYASDAISDVPLEGYGTNPALGPGGGGAGNFATNWRDVSFAHTRSRAHGSGNPIEDAAGGSAIQCARQAALAWLLEHQEIDGHWDARVEGSGFDADVIVTALALAAAVEANSRLQPDPDFRQRMLSAVDWLARWQKPDGSIAAMDGGPTPWGQGGVHAFAALAFAMANRWSGKSEKVGSLANTTCEYACFGHAFPTDHEPSGWSRQAFDTYPDLRTSALMAFMLDDGWTNRVLHSENFDRRGRMIMDLTKPRWRAVRAGANTSTLILLWTCYGQHEWGVSTCCSMFNCRQAKADLEEEILNGMLKEAPQMEVPLNSWEALPALCMLRVILKENPARASDAEKLRNDIARMIVDSQDEDGGWSGGGEWDQGWGRVGRTALFLRCLNEVSPAER